MKHEGRREGVSPAFHGLSRERKGNDRGVVIPLMQTAPSGAVWTLSDSSSELLTAVFELLTARESCSERVVIVIIVDGPAGPL